MSAQNSSGTRLARPTIPSHFPGLGDAFGDDLIDRRFHERAREPVPMVGLSTSPIQSSGASLKPPATWIPLSRAADPLSFSRAGIHPNNSSVTRALCALNNSSLALDLYAFFTYKAYAVSLTGHSLFIRYPDLMAQLGTHYNDQKDFKKNLRPILKTVQAVYPKLKLEVVRGGLVLNPCAPSIPPLPNASPIPLL